MYASAAQLRQAYDWCMTTRQPDARREQVRAAYAVLGDPRLRAEYDRGQVVGAGAGHYFHAAGSPIAGRQRTRRPARRPAVQQRRGSMPLRMPTVGSPERTRWRSLLAVAVLAAGVGTAIVVQARGVSSVPAVTRPDHRMAPARVAANQGELKPYVPTGACFTPDDSPQLEPAEPVTCAGPHRFEVVKTVDLLRLLAPGDNASQPASSAAAQGVCEREFASFTGLAGPVEDMWLSSLTTTGGSPPRAAVTCLVVSRHPRTGSAAKIAG